jgi:methyl-accepting chemotaxis protein
MSKSLQQIREELRERGVHDEALVAAMMDGFEVIESAGQKSRGGSVPIWIHVLLGTSILVNVGLAFMLNSSIDEQRMAIAALPKSAQITADLRKAEETLAKIETMADSLTNTAKTMHEAAIRSTKASEGVELSAKSMAETAKLVADQTAAFTPAK